MSSTRNESNDSSIETTLFLDTSSLMYYDNLFNRWCFIDRTGLRPEPGYALHEFIQTKGRVVFDYMCTMDACSVISSRFPRKIIVGDTVMINIR